METKVIKSVTEEYTNCVFVEGGFMNSVLTEKCGIDPVAVLIKGSNPVYLYKRDDIEGVLKK